MYTVFQHFPIKFSQNVLATRHCSKNKKKKKEYEGSGTWWCNTIRFYFHITTFSWIISSLPISTTSFSFFRPSVLSLPKYLLFLNVQLTGNRALPISVLFLSDKNGRNRIIKILSNLWYKVERKDNARFQIFCFSNS